MKPFSIETTIRWSDLDANKHLANASYMNFTSYARMGYLKHFGITLQDLGNWNLGPAVLREEFSFFKEGYDNEQVVITVEQTGISENGELFEFTQNLYKKHNGVHMAHSKIIGVWFSMETRKITAPPVEMLERLKSAIDVSKLRKMSLEDLKTLPVKPQNIDINTIL